MSDQGELVSDAEKQPTAVSEPRALQPQYKNSLLAAVGYLDLANALDFPANVWNQHPIPVFAQVLMGLGGSIAILTTYFAIWDLTRSWRNVKALREERAYLNKRLRAEARLPVIEDAWLGINYRELGWEIIDRMVMDAFMATAGILVGVGCLIAIRGDIPAVFLTSNVMSGYLGNSFVAAYGILNAAWSVYMWRRAHVNETAVSQHESEIGSEVLVRLMKHARRHKIYALVNGLSVFISGIGSEVSSTMWQGYCVLIPCIAGSIFCNYFWRYRLGYNRILLQSRGVSAETDIYRSLRLVFDIREVLKEDPEATPGIEELVAALIKEKQDTVVDDLLGNLGVTTPSRNNIATGVTSDNANETSKWNSGLGQVQARSRGIRSVDEFRFRDEERFLLEFYGYYLAEIDARKFRDKTPG